MACVVDDEQVMGTVMFEEEVANMIVELELWLLAHIELDCVGLIVEAVTKEFSEFISLS
jgi:hypothetical protein